jgi:hypothetical protein
MLPARIFRDVASALFRDVASALFRDVASALFRDVIAAFSARHFDSSASSAPAALGCTESAPSSALAKERTRV